MNDFQVALDFIKLHPKKWADIVSWLLFNSAELKFQYQEELKFQMTLKSLFASHIVSPYRK